MTLPGNGRPAPAIIRLLPFIPFLAVMLLEYQTVASIVHRWWIFEESYSQGLLLVVVAVYLFVRKYREIQPVESFYPFWLAPFVLGLAGYLLGAFILVQALQQLVLLPLMWCSLAIFWGWRQARHFIVPIGIIFFSINIWEVIRPHLQWMTTHVDGFLLGLLGVKFYMVGTFVHLPGIGSFQIARGCSGLNYFLVGLTIALIFGEVRELRWLNRFWLVLAGGILSLVANWLRAFFIIYAGFATKMTSVLVVNHSIHTDFGWVIFALALLPLFWVARKLEKNEGPLQRPGSAASAPRAATQMPWAALLLSVALVACTGFISREPDEGSFGGKFSYAFPLVPSQQWLPVFQRRLLDWQPAVMDPDARKLQTFQFVGSRDDAPLNVNHLLISLDSYNYQRDGAEVVQWGNSLYDDDQLNPVGHFQINAGQGVTLSGLVLHSQQFKQDVYVAYGYYVGGRWVANGLDVKLAQLHGVLAQRRDASRLVYGITCNQCTLEQAKQALTKIGARLVPRVKANLDEHFRGTQSVN